MLEEAADKSAKDVALINITLVSLNIKKKKL